MITMVRGGKKAAFAGGFAIAFISQSYQNAAQESSRRFRNYPIRVGRPASSGVCMKIVTTGAALLVILAVLGILWLANAHLMPPQQKIEQTIPDDHLPH
jgi:hypothetical protein